jgi:hypothetical protein
MIVGHYGVSFAAKAADNRIPLWLLFIAAQFVDVLWAFFVLLGIEKVGIVPGITASSPLDLYYYPFTHSLLASFVWFGVAVVGYRLLRPGKGTWRMGLIVGAAVLSHWVLDLLVHRPDLPLYDDAAKVGLGLWNYPAVSFLLEAGLLLGGMWLYLRGTFPVNTGGKYGIPVLSAILLISLAGTSVGPALPSPAAYATVGLISYFLAAGAVYWLERKRKWPRANRSSPP